MEKHEEKWMCGVSIPHSNIIIDKYTVFAKDRKLSPNG